MNLTIEYLNVPFTGKADVIVTGDKKMLRLKEHKGVKIKSLKEFLKS